MAINNTKIITVYKKNLYTKFQNFKRILKGSFIIYADFESTVPYFSRTWTI